ncbi:MAG: phosphopantothenoylcysteine decarboxylase [Planctomycetia bacterium]|nr:phosphopantothenoylcysteine decarboxylase [Planctomycetia bacterium]
MARILITSGPTRQYIDPVRFLSNASSGRMGAALATAALRAGHEVLIVSGPVEIAYPREACVVPVMTTAEMLAEAERLFPTCDGVIGVAAPCDYRPCEVSPHKLSKTGKRLVLSFVETPDIIATLGLSKRPDQWVVGFALETDDPRLRAVRKMNAKNCDMLVLNGPSVINSPVAEVEILRRPDVTVAKLCGSKRVLGRKIFQIIEKTLILPTP